MLAENILKYDFSKIASRIECLHVKDYAHLSGVAVYEGQEVFPWDIIGYLGNSGNADGFHLHFEVNDAEDRSILNPYPYLP